MWERFNVGGQQALSQGKTAEAEQMFTMAITEAEKEGNNNWLATSCVNMANLMRQQGRYPESEPFYQRALQAKERAVGPLHIDLVGIMENYARMLRAAGREKEAQKLDSKAQAIFSKR